METLEQFFTDEFFRYSAECRRLGRLARRTQIETAHSKRQAWLGRFGEFRRPIISAGGRLKHAFVPHPVRVRR
jgi:hypothetical protein